MTIFRILLCSILFSPIISFAQDCKGGKVTTDKGRLFVRTIVGDGVADEIAFSSFNASEGTNFTFVVTDNQNKILGLPDGNVVDFEGAGTGICRVWGLAYTGNILAGPDDIATEVALSDGCAELSKNFVTIVRRAPRVSGGLIFAHRKRTRITTCAGDGVADKIPFISRRAVGPNFTYVVTNEENEILGLPDGNVVDFEGAGAGICKVWGLSYFGTLTAKEGDNINQVALSDLAFALSRNFVTVNRIAVNGGTVSTVNGETEVNTTAGDEIADLIEFQSRGADQTANFTYVVTDDNNKILGLPPGNSVDFEGAGPGICRVWGLSYTGQLIAQPDDIASEVALSDGCFDLSDNFVTVVRTSQVEQNQNIRFFLVNTETNQPLQEISDGDIIDVTPIPYPNISIEAVTTYEVESVALTLEGQFSRTENFVPYALGGDNKGNFNAVPQLVIGTNVLSAISYTGNKARGTVLATASISFQLVSARTQQFDIISSDVLSVADLALSVYPNPSQDFVSIQTNVDIDSPLELHILDINGQIVSRAIVQTLSTNVPYTIDLKHLSSGMYFIQVQNEAISRSQRFIKQ